MTALLRTRRVPVCIQKKTLQQFRADNVYGSVSCESNDLQYRESFREARRLGTRRRNGGGPLPSLVETSEGRTDATGWTLAPLGEAALNGDQRLEQVGQFGGAVLVQAESGQALAERPHKVTLPPPPLRIDVMSSADYQALLERAITRRPRAGIIRI